MSTRLRPTLSGLYWLLAVFALIATAINYNHNLSFALAFVLLSLWLQSAWLAWRNLAALECRLGTPEPVFAGGMLSLSARLQENASRPREALQLAQAERPSTPGSLGALREATLTLHLPAPRRGVQHLAGLSLCSRYPLGLWQASQRLADSEALVYPAPHGTADLPRSAPIPAHRKQAAENFQGVRNFAPGDSPRRVNWRVFSRSDTLVINQFDGSAGGESLWLRWDQTEGDIESRLSQLAAWILEAQRQGKDFGLQLGRQALAPSRGHPHTHACLAALARFSGEPAA